ncbi:hsp90-like protein [Phlyctema vagabunda]|uniref:Hsp90-like protein n=1 Tax=Phlyctema vagabunda TaxID=108571 RepID=A0ABR4PC42_9HELO
MSDSEQQASKPVAFLSSEHFAVERVFPIRNLLKDDKGLGIQLGSQEEEEEEKDTDGKLHTDSKTTEEAPCIATEQSTPAASNDVAIQDAASIDAIPSPGLAEAQRIFPQPPYPHIPPLNTLRRLSNPATGPDLIEVDQDGNVASRISERAQMVPTTSGSPIVLPGTANVEGKQLFYRCEDEPIHVPGAIQKFGALVALKYDSDGDLKVRVASENSQKVLQYNPEELFALKSFYDILEPTEFEGFENRVDHAIAIGTDDLQETNLDVFTTSITSFDGITVRVWCALHVSQGTKDLVICEFEAYTDVFRHDDLFCRKKVPPTPTHTIDNEVSMEERVKSTTIKSEPLRAVQLARRRKQSALGTMEVFNAMTQAQQQLGAAKTIQSVLDILVGLVAELTCFHRVMVYQFDAQKNGCVVSELVDPQASDDLFRGLNFPASDIPKQARDLYIINRIRMLYDRDAETARFVGRSVEDSAKPLDLTHSYLRAMSPLHIKYLTNMGVRSSMSISLVLDNDLWGLVACHHYGDEGIRVSLPIRELCRNIGECAATNIDRLLMLRRIQARKPLSCVPPTQSPAGFIAASSADLLRVFDADFGLLNIQDEARAIGRLDPYPEALALLAHLQTRRHDSITYSDNINRDYKDLKYAPGINTIAGLLVIPLSVGGHDFIVFFRRGQLKEVRWAGNPYEKALKPGNYHLEPRASFKRWTEYVVGVSSEWTDDQKDTAEVLSLLYGRFIEIWRQKESAGQNSRMTRLLIRNSSHEVRTPLNAIVNYLEIALENQIDEATQMVLQKAYKASKSLIYVIDDLLNLTKAEEGRIAAPNEIFDLGATVSEVITAFRKEAMRKGLDLTVSTHPGLPEMVKGDPSRLRQIISNITSNAFQNSVEGGVKVDIKPVSRQGERSIVDITVQDVGFGMSEEQLDSLFREFEQVREDDDRSTGSTISTPTVQGPKESLGLGLAVVARYVRNMNGQIRVLSEPGKGTIFSIELPFEHAASTPAMSHSDFSGLIRNFSTPDLAPVSLSHSEPSLEHTSQIPSATEKPPLVTEEKSVDQTIYVPEMRTGNDESPVDLAVQLVSSTGETVGSIIADPIRVDLPIEISIQSVRTPPLSVLVAEDNPVNARLLNRRLTKVGHAVELTYDGQACHDYFSEQPQAVDVVLMDLQMPLVDGFQSTKMIRQSETIPQDSQATSPRVPIIAVSASLVEERKSEYMQCGFDGWILKPIDFSRLDLILRGIKDTSLRAKAQYIPGSWEKGGWFVT